MRALCGAHTLAHAHVQAHSSVNAHAHAPTFVLVSMIGFVRQSMAMLLLVTSRSLQPCVWQTRPVRSMAARPEHRPRQEAAALRPTECMQHKLWRVEGSRVGRWRVNHAHSWQAFTHLPKQWCL